MKRRSTSGRWRSRRTSRRRSSCRSGSLGAPPPAARGLPAAAGIAGHRQQALGVPAVRPHGSHQHAGVPGHGRRRGAYQGNAPRAGAVGRRQRPVRLPGSVHRRAAGGGRSGAQRRLRRRPADRRDQLPELRQSREARNHVAVRSRGRGYRRGVPRARHPDHRRQRQPLQRDRRQGRPADARARRRRA